MKIKKLLFVVLPLFLAASSALMPGLVPQIIYKGAKITEFNLEPFELQADETSDKSLVSSENQNKGILVDPKNKLAMSLENSGSQTDTITEKITPDMFAMLFDLGTAAEPSMTSSTNSRKDGSKNQTQTSSSLPGSSRFGVMPSPVAIGGLSGKVPAVSPNPRNTNSVEASADPERPWEMVSDPIEGLDSENLDPLFGGHLNDPLIIVGFSAPLSGGNASNNSNLDPSSPLNPLPPPGDTINPFAPPELTPPGNRPLRPNPRPRPFQFPRPGNRARPIRTADPSPVPEPDTMILMGIGLFVLIFYKRGFKKR